MYQKNPTRKIDFLIAGTQKGGTSALDKYLREHPEIGMAKSKELHFFDDEEIFSQPKIDYSIYENQFDFESNKKVYGEATPIYLYWEASCRRIWEYNPNIKLVFILRNPITIAFSHWNMEYDRNADLYDFSSAIKNEEQRLKEALPLQHRVFSYADRGFYSNQILRYKSLFRDDQMLFIKYEEFKIRQKQVLFKIFDFLGVESDSFNFVYQEVHNIKSNSNLSIDDKNHLIDLFENDIHKVEELLNWDCSDWLK